MPLRYVEMTAPDVTRLDRDETVFFMPVSPIEVHGPHLPLGTDVMVAQEVQRRVQARLALEHPEVTQVELPPLYAGSDALPAPGSLSVQAESLSRILLDYARGLSSLGFKYLLISDNHGGPRHHLGIDHAARKAWRKHGFHLIDPFIELYGRMVRLDPLLLSTTGLSAGSCGDDSDSHAGTNETSLMLAVRGEDRNLADYERLPASEPPALGGLPRTLAGLGRVLAKTGAKNAGDDLGHLARMLAWTGEKGFTPYLGAPARATREAGEAMLSAHVDVALELLRQAFAGESGLSAPQLGWLSFLRRLPE